MMKLADTESVYKRFLRKYSSPWFFIITFIVLLTLTILPIILFSRITIVSFIASVLFVAHLILGIMYRIGSIMEELLHKTVSINQLVKNYVLVLFFMIFLFSSMYIIVEFSGAGYLTYGTCNDKTTVNYDDIFNDPQRVQSITGHAYFSSITLFSVGYGDICPMGINKIVAILNALVGNVLTVIIVALAINNYTKKQDGK